MKPKIKTNLGRWLLPVITCLTATAQADVLINLDATALPLGPLTTWTNTGTVSGNFVATGAPTVTTVAGLKAVSFSGGGDLFAGPLAPAAITGVNPSCSIEVWALNPGMAGEETLVAWGKRDTADGANMAFNYGNAGAYGAVGHWGGQDLGWKDAGGGPVTGVWHHLVYTYDGGGVAATGTTRVYADGVLQNSEFNGNLNTVADTAFVLGAQNNGAGAPQGFNSGLSIAKVRIHNVVLTPAQIAAQFAAEFPQIYPAAYLSGAKVQSSSSFVFTVEDRAPASVTNPPTFTVAVGGIRGGWQIGGGDGIFESSLTSPAIVVAGGGALQLSLVHRYNFEDEYDGGFIQYNINGEGWTTLENSSFTQNGYFPTPLIGNGFQLGKVAFNKQSAGYGSGALITSTANLPAVAPGDNIQIRLLGTWDEGYTPEGIDWEINHLTLTSGATVVSDKDFTAGNGGYTAAVVNTGNASGTPWGYVVNAQPALGTLSASKTGGLLTLTQPIQWVPGRDYSFTISGKDSNGGDLVYTALITTPSLPLALAKTWPVNFPGPLGTAGNWGIRTYLNEGINTVEALQPMLDFLLAASDRTPTLTPNNVVDVYAPSLNFADKNTNGGLQGVLSTSPLPFPGEALSTSTNGGVSRDDNHVITSAHGTLQITEESDYTINIHCDDGYALRVKSATGAPPTFVAVSGPSVVDAVAQNIVYFPNGTGDADTRAVLHLTPGLYKLEYVTWEGGGGFYYQMTAAKGFFLNNYDTDQWAPFNQIVTQTAPVPYPSMVGNWTVESSLPTAPGGAGIGGNLEGALTAVNAAVLADPVAATSSWAEINFTDPASGGGGRIPSSVPFPRDLLGVDDDNFALRLTGTLHIPEDGTYLIGFQGDDGSNLSIGGVNSGFSALVENATGAGVIGRANTIAANIGSLGATANFSPVTSAVWSQPGAIAGDTNKGIGLGTNDGQRTRVPFLPALNPSTSFSVELWVVPAAIPGGLTCIVSSGNFATAARSGYLIYMDNANGWSFRGYTGSGSATAFSITGGGNDGLGGTTNVAPIAGNTYHIVGTWDSATTTAKLYVNSVLVGTQVVTSPAYAPATAALSTGSLNVGSRADNSFNWAGVADELAFYPTALSPISVASHYENGVDAGRTTPYQTVVLADNPLGYWRFNETQQPRADLNTITTDVPTGDSSTVGRIFLTAGDYPISSLFYEAGGGAYYEIFAARDVSNAPLKTLKNGGWPSIPVPPAGLPLAAHPAPVPPVIQGNLTLNPLDNNLSLTFKSVPYATYTLQTSQNMVDWEDILSDLEATSATTTIQGDPGAFFFYNIDEDKRFFRVKANP
jgi:hypothetical protein